MCAASIIVKSVFDFGHSCTRKMEYRLQKKFFNTSLFVVRLITAVMMT